MFKIEQVKSKRLKVDTFLELLQRANDMEEDTFLEIREIEADNL